MFRATPIRCLMIACLFAFATSSMWAQTGTKSSKSSTAKSTTTQKPAAKKFNGRLPRNFTKIGLLPKQREEIYAIQKKYYAEIKDLEKQLDDLKAKQTEEVFGVLSTEQKAALKALEEKRKTKSAPKTAATEE